jgi:hypothetical protein
MERKRSKEFENAKRKMTILKGFYIHLLVFIGVNILLWFMQANWDGGTPDFRYWLRLNSTYFWGAGIFAHGVYTFYTVKLNGKLFKSWEEKKIKEIMEKEDERLRKL